MLIIHPSHPPHNTVTGSFLEFQGVDFTIGITQENYGKLKVETSHTGQNVLCYYGLRATISAEEAQKIRNLTNQ